MATNWRVSCLWQGIDMPVLCKELTCQCLVARNLRVSCLWQRIDVSVPCKKSCRVIWGSNALQIYSTFYISLFCNFFLLLLVKQKSIAVGIVPASFCWKLMRNYFIFAIHRRFYCLTFCLVIFMARYSLIS